MNEKIFWLSLAAIGCLAGGGQTIHAAQDSAALSRISQKSKLLLDIIITGYQSKVRDIEVGNQQRQT